MTPDKLAAKVMALVEEHGGRLVALTFLTYDRQEHVVGSHQYDTLSAGNVGSPLPETYFHIKGTNQ